MQKKLRYTTIELIQGDITEEEVDVIVNAANEKLIGGGGVDGAIRRVGGDPVIEECDAIRARQGGCPTGKSVITTELTSTLYYSHRRSSLGGWRCR